HVCGVLSFIGDIRFLPMYCMTRGLYGTGGPNECDNEAHGAPVTVVSYSLTRRRIKYEYSAPSAVGDARVVESILLVARMASSKQASERCRNYLMFKPLHQHDEHRAEAARALWTPMHTTSCAYVDAGILRFLDQRRIQYLAGRDRRRLLSCTNGTRPRHSSDTWGAQRGRRCFVKAALPTSPACCQISVSVPHSVTGRSVAVCGRRRRSRLHCYELHTKGAGT
ncbi:unnamed protein product, partial [Rangifer tarandus platyrhynchus]